MKDLSSYPNVGFPAETTYQHPSDFTCNMRWLYHNIQRQYIHWDGVTRIWKPLYGYKNITGFDRMKESSFNTHQHVFKVKNIVELENRECCRITCETPTPQYQKDLQIICGIDQEKLFDDGFSTPDIIFKSKIGEGSTWFGKMTIPYGYYSVNTHMPIISIEYIGKRTVYSLSVNRDVPVSIGPFIARPYLAGKIKKEIF